MTKRDVADIVLVWMAITFILAFFASILSLGVYLGMTDEAMKYTERWTSILFQTLHCLLLLFVNYVLIFKRALILNLVFPVTCEKTLSIPDGLDVLASYGFWIRLIGIFTFLTSATNFFSQLAIELAVKRRIDHGAFWMIRSGQELLAVIVALFIIWKADWIAETLGKLGSFNKVSEPTSTTRGP